MQPPQQQPLQGPRGEEPRVNDDTFADEERVSFKGRAGRCGFSALVLSALLCIGWSKRWQQQLVMASPRELYQVHKTVTSLLPGAKPKTEPELNRQMPAKPEPFFNIYGGLWYIRVEGLCEPISETFDPLIDRASCRQRLRSFCEDLRVSMPGAPGLDLAGRVYANCLQRVNSDDGIIIPLFSGLHEISFPWQEPEKKAESDQRQEFKTLAELEAEVALDQSDCDVDFCKTVADCELLEEVRPWILAICVVFYSAVALVGLATIFLLLALVWPSSKAGSCGCCSFAMTLPLIVAVACLYAIMDNRYPLASLVRTEDLFYFALPMDAEELSAAEREGAAEPAALAELLGEAPPGLAAAWPRGAAAKGELEALAVGPNGGLRFGNNLRLRKQRIKPVQRPSGAASLQVSDSDSGPDAGMAAPSQGGAGSVVVAAVGKLGIPPARWKGVLVTLTGNLLTAVLTGDLSQISKMLADALERALKLSEVILKKWGHYALKALGDSDSSPDQRAKALLDPLLSGFERSAAELSEAEEACEALGQRGCKVLASAANEVLEVKAEFQDLAVRGSGHVTTAGKIAKESLTTIAATGAILTQVKEPVLQVINHVRKSFSEHGASPQAALTTAANMLMDQDTIDDLRLVFRHVFQNLPKIVSKLLVHARQLVELGKELYAFFLSASSAVSKAARILDSLATALPSVQPSATPALKQLAMTALARASPSRLETAKEAILAVEASALVEAGSGQARAGGGLPAEGLGLLGDASPLLSGPFQSVASKVGSVFLHEIELMGGERGFRAACKWSECSWTHPSACTHFGCAYFANLVVMACLVVVSSGYCLGKL